MIAAASLLTLAGSPAHPVTCDTGAGIAPGGNMAERDLSSTEPERGMWSSRFMFILAAAGSAIGLGNIWKFPYMAGKYGGGAFVLMYLACIGLIGIPILIAEILIGRDARKNPVGAFSVLTGGNKFWTSIGFLGVASGFVILSYYSVVGGWTVDYFARSASGIYLDTAPETIRQLFAEMLANPWEQAVWHTVFMAATMGIVLFGVKEGLERWIEVLMPLLFVLLGILVVYGLVAGDAARGLSYLFLPDWSRLVTNAAGEYTPRPMLEAMGQAFFTLSLGMGAMITYGSYLGEKESIPGSAVMVALLDTVIALLASIAIFTVVFQYDLDPTAAGPGLVFEVLPLAFSKMPAGRIIGTAFFLLLAFAALTSAISLLEVVVAHFIDDRKWARRAATVIMGTIIWGLGLFSAFSYNLLDKVTLLEDKEGRAMPILDSIDLIATNYMLPIGGFFIALFAGWFIRKEHRERQLLGETGSQALYKAWLFVIRFLTPVAVGLLILFMIDKHLGIAERILGAK
jgi:NSS family neurotransmitter:Na+ symporter